MSVMSVVVEENPEEEQNTCTAPDGANDLLIGSGVIANMATAKRTPATNDPTSG
jgi:hypothetical protein